MSNQTEQHQPLIRRNTFGMRSPAGSMRRVWGLIHVRPLTIAIGIAEILFIIIQALIAGSYLSSSSHKTAAVIHMTVVILTAISVFLLLAGVFYKVPLLLGPHLVMQITLSIILILLTLGSLVCLFSGTSVQMKITLVHSSFPITSETAKIGSHFNFSMISNVLAGILLGIAIIYFFTCLISMWSFGVVLDCYRFLSKCETEKSELSSVVTPQLMVEPKPSAIIPATDF